MTRKKATVFLAVVIAVVIIAALALSLTSRQQAGRGDTTIQSVANTSGSNSSTQISSASNASKIQVISSPSALPVVQGWISQYDNQQNNGGASVSYSREAERPANISRLLSTSSADLAIVDEAPSENPSSNGALEVPVSPRAGAIVYNIPGFPDIPSGLKLNATALAAIFAGNVTYWDDAAIKTLNPGLGLPHEKIVVVHLAKDDSSADLLDRYLFPNANERNITWTRSSLVVPNEASLSTTVGRTPYSIGYIDYAYAVQTKMTYAALQNSRGNIVMPSPDTISDAVRNGTRIGNATALSNMTGGNYSFAANIPRIEMSQMRGNSSYPVVGFYYAAFVNGTNSQTVAVKDFVRWLAGPQGQRIVQDAQYPAIYDSDLLKAYLKRQLG